MSTAPSSRNALDPRQVRALLRMQEIPDCGCKVKYQPWCQLGDRPGCPERQQASECDCPRLPGPPCPHIEAIDYHDFPLSTDEWIELLRLVDPEDYNDPPPPAAPGLAFDRQTRVALYAMRHGPNPDVAACHLYHPDDLSKAPPEHMAGRLRQRRNGRPASELGPEVAGRAAPDLERRRVA